MAFHESPLRYFVGAVAPGQVFINHVVGLLEITNRLPPNRGSTSQEWEISFIALIAYFEAFCKDQFAALINIRPELLRSFRAAGRETLVDAADLAEQGSLALSRIGSLLAERVEFGTPREINRAYSALLDFTPISKKQAKEFDKLLLIRNQLVHHGGVVTPRFARQHDQPVIAENMFLHSIVLKPVFFNEAHDLVFEVARNIVRQSGIKLLRFMEENNLSSSPDQREAIEYLTEPFR